MAKTRWFRRGDVIPALLCLALAAVLLILQLPRGIGDAVRVQTPDGDVWLPLDADAERTFRGENGSSLTVTVADGRVCVSYADCPDQVCVNTGWLSASGQTAACLPAGILLTVEARGTHEPDAVAR